MTWGWFNSEAKWWGSNLHVLARTFPNFSKTVSAFSIVKIMFIFRNLVFKCKNILRTSNHTIFLCIWWRSYKSANCVLSVYSWIWFSPQTLFSLIFNDFSEILFDLIGVPVDSHNHVFRRYCDQCKKRRWSHSSILQWNIDNRENTCFQSQANNEHSRGTDSLRIFVAG